MKRPLFRWILALAGLSLLASSASGGSRHELVASFNAPPMEPAKGSLVLAPDGYFWGTTNKGGAYGSGTIYKIKGDGSEWRTVLSFSDRGTTNRGSYPSGGLLDDGSGYLWGTTQDGGANDFGTLFKVNVTTGELTTLIDFTGNGGDHRGSYPSSPLVRDADGYLWGATAQGGTGWVGTIFKFNPNTGTLTTMTDLVNDGTTGYWPIGGIVSDGAGYYWGTTYEGGSHNRGTVFKVEASTGILTYVLSFTSFDPNRGSNPTGAMINNGDGYLWGVAGGFWGTIFKINTATGALTTVVEFTNNGATNKGAGPNGSLVSDGAGNFWGTTGTGGANDVGTVFKLNATTGQLTTLVEFTDNGATHRGAVPFSGLVSDGAGSFLGTTSRGGSHGFGTVFKIDGSKRPLTTLSD